MARDFGVALTKCYYCGEGDRILMNMRLTPGEAAKVERANGKVLDMEPCGKCKGYMKAGVILITIDDEKSVPGWNRPPVSDGVNERRVFMPNPYRTGGFFVLTEEAVKRIFNGGEAAMFALKHRWIFIEHKAAEQLGLFEAEPTGLPEKA